MSLINHSIEAERLIAKQVAMWEAKKRLEKEDVRPGRGKVQRVAYGPYLLISREKGSGGRTVADLVGQRLGWQVFDREIVDEVAKRAQVRQQLIESLDEHDRAVIDDIILSALDRDNIGTVGYLHHLKQVIHTLGQHGDVIIMGRGARHILPTQFGLNVRFVAPFEVRVQRVAAKEGLTMAAARAVVENADRERAAFIRRHFQKKVDDPLDFDLILNTAELSAAAAAEIVLTALKQKLGVTPKQ
ncbi:MAG: cytidylate kinase-like family protein [Abditibacteriales bacterium]|nr:cytidylate kinase-like family protein [Abditibacteriales bacterium]MDW8368508.1 cytidylate kinase-like family protein [Abditibacteriales bacterium]